MKKLAAIILFGTFLVPAGFHASNAYAISHKNKRKMEYIGGGTAGGALIGGLAGGGKGALIGAGAGAAGGYIVEKKTRHHHRQSVRNAHHYRHNYGR